MSDAILKLMSDISEGNIVLPDIQRSFVWKEEQIYDLYDSLLRGYPIGSFLFWKAIGPAESDKGIVYHRLMQDYRESDRLPPQVELKPGETKTFVLDGQQRLQSMYLGLEGSYDGRELYLDLLPSFHATQCDMSRRASMP